MKMEIEMEMKMEMEMEMIESEMQTHTHQMNNEWPFIYFISISLLFLRQVGLVHRMRRRPNIV